MNSFSQYLLVPLAGPLALWSYFKVGKMSTHHAMAQAKARGDKPESRKKPFWQNTALGTSHCGSGCTLGDIVAEWFIVLVPLTLFGKTVFAAWVIDYILAFLFGIAFQYFTIKPMKGLSPKDGFREALKADTLSLTVWQVGMYGWMAIVIFVLIGHEIANLPMKKGCVPTYQTCIWGHAPNPILCVVQSFSLVGYSFGLDPLPLGRPLAKPETVSDDTH